MTWDYSIYPELSEKQDHCFSNIGATLYMIQLAEHAISLCCTFVMGTDQLFSQEDVYSSQRTGGKVTLGTLIAEIRKKMAVHPQLDQMLEDFRTKRNFFVHRMFEDEGYGLMSDHNIAKTDRFLNDLQDKAWSVQNVFWACLLSWTRQIDVYEQLPADLKDNPHFRQVQEKGFDMLFDPSKFDQVRIVWRRSQPNVTGQRNGQGTCTQ